MNYIWEMVIKAKQNNLKSSELFFKQGNDISPWYEQSFSSLNQKEIENTNIEINSFYRFNDLFSKFLNEGFLENIEFKEKFFDLVIHFLSEIDVFSTRRDIDDMNSDLDSTNTYNRMLSGKEPLDVVLDYNKKVENGKINRVDEFLKFYGNGSTQEGLKYIKKDLLTVDIGSQYISSGSKSLIQDALFTNSIVNSGIILNGEEHFNNVLKLTNRNQLIDVLNGDGIKNRNEDSDNVKHYKNIKKTKDDFIKYLEDGMSR